MDEKEINSKLRMQFVEKWAAYVISNPNWSRLQAELIDSQLDNAKKIKLTKEQVKAFKSQKEW